MELLESFPSFSIRAIIRFMGSMYLVSCRYFSRYCCSSVGFSGLETALFTCPGVLIDAFGEGAMTINKQYYRLQNTNLYFSYHSDVAAVGLTFEATEPTPDSEPFG